MLPTPNSLARWLVAALLSLPSAVMGAVVAWDSITTNTTQGTPSTDPNNGFLYENDVTVVTSFSAGGSTYVPLIEFPAADFVLKASPLPTRVWYERNEIPSNGNDTGYTGSALANLQDMFSTPLRINFGSDNTFARTLASIDFVSVTGVQINTPIALTDAGVTVIERGANDSDFSVRLVTSIDGAGNALSFSPTFTLNGGDPFGAGLNSIPHALWDSATSDGLGPFDIPEDLDRTQEIGGLLLTFDQFGLSVGDRVYGYEIASATSGLDLLPSGAAFISDTLPPGALTVIVPSPEPDSGFVVLGILIGTSLLWHRQRRITPTPSA